MNIEEFRQIDSQQIKSYPLALQALWHDYRGDWQSSHQLIDRESDKDCAWVHAYLHRVEGDLWNARYWYRRSGKPESKLNLVEERQQIAKALLENY